LKLRSFGFSPFFSPLSRLLERQVSISISLLKGLLTFDAEA